MVIQKKDCGFAHRFEILLSDIFVPLFIINMTMCELCDNNGRFGTTHQTAISICFYCSTRAIGFIWMEIFGFLAGLRCVGTFAIRYYGKWHDFRIATKIHGKCMEIEMGYQADLKAFFLRAVAVSTRSQFLHVVTESSWRESIQCSSLSIDYFLLISCVTSKYKLSQINFSLNRVEHLQKPANSLLNQ